MRWSKVGEIKTGADRELKKKWPYQASGVGWERNKHVGQPDPVCPRTQTTTVAKSDTRSCCLEAAIAVVETFTIWKHFARVFFFSLVVRTENPFTLLSSTWFPSSFCIASQRWPWLIQLNVRFVVAMAFNLFSSSLFIAVWFFIDWALCGIFNFSVCGTFCRSTGMMTPGPISRLIQQPTVVNMSVKCNYWH